MPSILSPELVARLVQFRLATGRRVEGRYAGSHASRRYGSSVDFADHRDYVPGDDPRAVDRSAYLRLGRLLVRLYEAEDEAAVRVVLDLSASMGFGRKLAAAREVAAALVALAASGQDRVRVLVTAGHGGPPVIAGPWLRGGQALPASEAFLLAHAAAPPADDTGHAPGRPGLVPALRRAIGEGPRGPVVLISDLLDDSWPDVLRGLGAGRGDRVLIHLLGRDDLEPAARGDLRLIDSETGQEIEVGISDRVLDEYQSTRDAWLADVAVTAGRHGIAYGRLADDEDVTDLLLTDLRALGVVA